MSNPIPLIRAASLVPMIRWMLVNGRPIDALLSAADLGYVNLDDADRPVPLMNVAAFFKNAGRTEGVDIGCRVVSQTTLGELAMIGKIVLGSQTPREAILRVAAAMPYHCSHEHFVVTQSASGLHLREGWSVRLDDETLHIAQQFVASIIALICSMTHISGSVLSSVEMVPHPQAGLDHVSSWLKTKVAASHTRTLSIVIGREIADSPFRKVARDRTVQMTLADMRPMTADSSLSDSARVVIGEMLKTGMPTAERLSVASGLSLRTLQRRLADEDTSFSLLLEGVRRDAALAKISDAQGALSSVAATLGYAHQSALTRAVRRWTGLAPSEIKAAAEN